MTGRAPRGPKPWVRIVIAAAALATCWHLVASFLWIAPSSPAREIVPGEALESYMLPFFGQSWSVFAPDPINGDLRFEVRAVESREGGEHETEWVDATAAELTMLREQPFPPRAAILSTEAAAHYQSAYAELTASEQEVVAGDFVGEDGSDEAGAPEEALRDALEAAEDGGVEGERTQIEELLAEDRRSSAYATQVARAVWGEDVTRVQFRVSRQNVIPFAKRNDPDAERPAPQVTETGWREPVVEAGQSGENFAEVFRESLARSRA